jgi:hypothetical protein
MRNRNQSLLKAAAFVAALVIAPAPLIAATTTITGAGAIAPALQFSNPVNLDFGELVITTAGSAGSIVLDPATGVGALTNASQVGTAARGSIDLTGRRGVAVNFTVVAAPLACDVAYIGACTGTPTLTLANDFVGQISNTNCPGGGIRCTDTLHVGGTFAFAGTEEGRWTSTLTLTANYQ